MHDTDAQYVITRDVIYIFSLAMTNMNKKITLVNYIKEDES